MDKVDKIRLTIDNPEHIVTIDKALQRCAELLINNFISESNEEFLIRESFELEEDWRDQLDEVFKASRYCSTEGFDVGEIEIFGEKESAAGRSLQRIGILGFVLYIEYVGPLGVIKYGL